MPAAATTHLRGTRYLLFYTETVPAHTGKPTGRTTMAKKRTDRRSDAAPASGQAATPKTVSASKVGLSLTISDKALKDFDRIQEKTIKAAEADQKFSRG